MSLYMMTKLLIIEIIKCQWKEGQYCFIFYKNWD